jgi:hypothetical protein
VRFHDGVNNTLLSFLRFANLKVLGDRKFRPCGRTSKKKLPDDVVYGLNSNGGALVLDTTVAAPLAPSHLDGSAANYCNSAIKKRNAKFKEYLGRNPTLADSRYPDKPVNDLNNSLSMIDISDGLGKITFLPMSFAIYGGYAPEVPFLLSMLASRLADHYSDTSSSHLYAFFKSTMKKNLSLSIAHQLCIAHSTGRDWLINNQRYQNDIALPTVSSPSQDNTFPPPSSQVGLSP